MKKHQIGTRRRFLRNLLDSLDGRFVSVSFVKKDGSDRTMVVQPHAVQTHLAENPSPSALAAAKTRAKRHRNLMPVYDAASRSIKSINLDTVTSIRADGSLLWIA